MKILKKITIILFIFMIIGLIEMGGFLIQPVSADSDSMTQMTDGGGFGSVSESEESSSGSSSNKSMFETLEDDGKSWIQMGEDKVNELGIDTSSVLSPIVQLTNALRIVGAIMTVLYLGILFIRVTRSVNNNGTLIASAKEEIGVKVLIAFLLLFGLNIFLSVIKYLDQLESSGN